MGKPNVIDTKMDRYHTRDSSVMAVPRPEGDRCERQQTVQRVVSTYIGKAFQNAVHAGLGAERKFATRGLIVDFTERNTRLNRLPHGFTGEHRRHDGSEKRDEPKQNHVAGVGWRQAWNDDGKQRNDGDAGAEKLAHSQRCGVARHHTKSHSQLLLLLPFFHGAFERVLGSSEPVTVGSGRRLPVSLSSAMPSPLGGETV